jgi:hypothetical protein
VTAEILSSEEIGKLPTAEEVRELAERLKSSEPLPVCPFDRLSPAYWTTPDDKPCPFCGQENTAEGPDKCRGADTRIMGQASTALLDLLSQRDTALKALVKIDAIRNSIIGCQSVNWSEHVYPLVAALGEAGFEGQEYEDARKNVGTLIERTNAAEARSETLLKERDEALNTLAMITVSWGPTPDDDDAEGWCEKADTKRSQAQTTLAELGWGIDWNAIGAGETDPSKFRSLLPPLQQGVKASEPVKMLVDADWLRRKVESDPDTDCEAGSTPSNGDGNV